MDFDISYKVKDILGMNGIKFIGQINNLFNKLYASSGEGKRILSGSREIFLLRNRKLDM